MKVLKSIYWNMYYELREQGKSTESTRKTGTIIVAIAILLNVFVILFLLNLVFPGIGEFIQDLIEDIFGRKGGRRIGKIIGLIAVGFFYLLVWLTLGSKSGYTKLIDEFNAIDPTEQKKASKMGLPYLIGTFIIFFIVLFVFMIINLS